MKNTKCVKIARVLILVAFILFLSAVITQKFNINDYVILPLYVLAFLLFVVGAVLAYIAALKDKEHMKMVKLSKNDERLNNITVLSKAKAFDAVLPILCLITIFTTLDRIIDVNASIILGVFCSILLILQVYYFIRLNKKCSYIMNILDLFMKN